MSINLEEAFKQALNGPDQRESMSSSIRFPGIAKPEYIPDIKRTHSGEELRAKALARVEQGEGVKDIAKSLHVSAAAIYLWISNEKKKNKQILQSEGHGKTKGNELREIEDNIKSTIALFTESIEELLLAKIRLQLKNVLGDS